MSKPNCNNIKWARDMFLYRREALKNHHKIWQLNSKSEKVMALFSCLQVYWLFGATADRPMETQKMMIISCLQVYWLYGAAADRPMGYQWMMMMMISSRLPLPPWTFMTIHFRLGWPWSPGAFFKWSMGNWSHDHQSDGKPVSHCQNLEWKLNVVQWHRNGN